MATGRAGAWRAAIPMLDTTPITFTASRRKTVRLAAIGVGFTLLGGWEAFQPGDWDGMPVAAVGWAALALGALGVAAAALSWFKPTTLTLSSSGFAMTTIVKTYETRWDQIERVFPNEAFVRASSRVSQRWFVCRQ